MLLAIDIGNTQIVVGLFQGKRLHGEFRMATEIKTADVYNVALENILKRRDIPVHRINGVILSSVVPALTAVFEEAVGCFSVKPLVVTSALDTGITLAYPRPEEVGADRIVNAAAAVHLYGEEGVPLIIIDFGTATTFDLVSSQGVYFGGAIAPGLMISSAALSLRAAQLPVIDLAVPQNVIGHDTVSSMQSGLIFGHVGLVHEMVDRIAREIPLSAWGGEQTASVGTGDVTGIVASTATSGSRLPGVAGATKVIATGGLAGLIAPLCKNITIVNPTLTLEGLMIIYQRQAR